MPFNWFFDDSPCLMPGCQAIVPHDDGWLCDDHLELWEAVDAEGVDAAEVVREGLCIAKEEEIKHGR